MKLNLYVTIVNNTCLFAQYFTRRGGIDRLIEVQKYNMYVKKADYTFYVRLAIQFQFVIKQSFVLIADC